MPDGFLGHSVSDSTDSRDFLFLDEDSEQESEPPVEVPAERQGEPATAAISPTEVGEPSLEEVVLADAELMDSSLSTTLSGTWRADWKLHGIDCPDCALKLSRAVKRLPGVEECEVSASTGGVSVSIDLEHSSFADANAVLRDMGHAPEVGWRQLKGIRASALSGRLGCTERTLVRRLQVQPAVLEAKVVDDAVFVRSATGAEPRLVREQQSAFTTLIGHEPRWKTISGDWGLRPDQKQLLGGLFGLLLLPVVLLADNLGAETWMLALIAIPGIAAGGWELLKESFNSLRRGQFGFETLILMAILGAMVLQAWFEALLVTVLVSLASHLEGSALRKARDAMQGGLDRLPTEARLMQSASAGIGKIRQMDLPSLSLAPPQGPTSQGGEGELVPVALINKGDRIEVRSGETVPVDGTIIEGSGLLDRSPLTGEPLPQRVGQGSLIEAGLVLERGPVVLETLATGEDTRLSELMGSARMFRNQPTRVHTSLELFTLVWVPAVLFGSVLIGLLMPESMLPGSGGWEGRLRLTLLLWVTSCPCALLIASPVPHSVALSLSSKRGVVAKGGDVLERLAKVNLALLDKTGTLTHGKPRLLEVLTAKGSRRDASLRLAAGLERSSNHPYAQAVLDEVDSSGFTHYEISELEDGEAGISGRFQGDSVAIGSSSWIEQRGFEISRGLQKRIDSMQGTGISLVGRSGHVIAALSFASDELNPHSSALLSDLRSQRVRFELLSGDNQAAVDRTAAALGIPVNICRGSLSPEQKVEWVRQRSRTNVTLMAGDGFNDAAAMALADVGISLGDREQLNLEAADVMLPAARPDLIGALLRLSRRTRHVVIQNIALSALLTFILVGAVLSGLNDQLWINVVAHELSAILVLLNATRLASKPFLMADDIESTKKQHGMFTVITGLFGDLYKDSREALAAAGDSLRPATN